MGVSPVTGICVAPIRRDDDGVGRDEDGVEPRVEEEEEEGRAGHDRAAEREPEDDGQRRGEDEVEPRARGRA